ncbi:MAG: TetR/AcrR family transcriptional regulator [Desulfonatronovibrionaceae bacterium]
MARNKKQEIISTAARLFAQHGFEDTTTLGIAGEAGVTEPLLYYHFRGKEEIFSIVIRDFFDQYQKIICDLPRETNTSLAKIANLLRKHTEIAVLYPHEAKLILSACPAMLDRGYSVCWEVLEGQKRLLDNYLEKTLREGIKSGEFKDYPIPETVAVLRCLINGIFRNKVMHNPEDAAYEEMAVEFCKSSLLRDN